MLCSISSLLLFWIPNFSSISLSLICPGEACSAGGCHGAHCTGDGCYSSACRASHGNGNSRGHGSDPGSKNVDSPPQDSWIIDGQLDDSIGKLTVESRTICTADCISCQNGLLAKCQENMGGLNYDKFDINGNNPLAVQDNQLLNLDDVHSEINKLKADFGTRTLSIIIKGGKYYPETYGDINKTQIINSSLSLENGTRVTWINLDENSKHSIAIINDNDRNDSKLFEKMIPYAGTAEYTFSLAGKYLFFDPDHPFAYGRIKVNDNSDAMRNVKMYVTD